MKRELREVTTMKVTKGQARWFSAEAERRNREQLSRENSASVLQWMAFEVADKLGKEMCPECNMPIMGKRCPSCNPQT